MALVRNWYGNGAADGPLTTSTTGRGDDAVSAVNGGTNQINVAGGAVVFTEDGNGARNFRYDLPAGLPEWALAARYTHAEATSGAVVLQVLDATPTQIARVDVAVNGALRLWDSTNTQIATSGAGLILADTTYRFVLYGGGGDASVAVWADAGGADPLSTLSGSTGSTEEARRFVVGAVTNITVPSGNRVFRDVEVYDVGEDVPPISRFGSVVRVIDNDDGYASPQTDIVTALSDDNNATWVQSPAEPAGTQVVYQLSRLTRTDIMTVVVRHDVADGSSMSRNIAILHDGNVLAQTTFNIPSGTTNRTLSTPSAVAAGEVTYLRITDTA